MRELNSFELANVSGGLNNIKMVLLTSAIGAIAGTAVDSLSGSALLGQFCNYGSFNIIYA